MAFPPVEHTHIFKPPNESVTKRWNSKESESRQSTPPGGAQNEVQPAMARRCGRCATFPPCLPSESPCDVVIMVTWLLWRDRLPPASSQRSTLAAIPLWDLCDFPRFNVCGFLSFFVCVPRSRWHGCGWCCAVSSSRVSLCGTSDKWASVRITHNAAALLEGSWSAPGNLLWLSDIMICNGKVWRWPLASSLTSHFSLFYSTLFDKSRFVKSCFVGCAVKWSQNSRGGWQSLWLVHDTREKIICLEQSISVLLIVHFLQRSLLSSGRILSCI